MQIIVTLSTILLITLNIAVILRASSIALIPVKFNGIKLVNTLHLVLVELSGRLFQQPRLYFQLPQPQLLRFSFQSTS